MPNYTIVFLKYNCQGKYVNLCISWSVIKVTLWSEEQKLELVRHDISFLLFTGCSTKTLSVWNVLSKNNSRFPHYLHLGVVLTKFISENSTLFIFLRNVLLWSALLWSFFFLAFFRIGTNVFVVVVYFMSFFLFPLIFLSPYLGWLWVEGALPRIFWPLSPFPGYTPDHITLTLNNYS